MWISDSVYISSLELSPAYRLACPHGSSLRTFPNLSHLRTSSWEIKLVRILAPQVPWKLSKLVWMLGLLSHNPHPSGWLLFYVSLCSSAFILYIILGSVGPRLLNEKFTSPTNAKRCVSSIQPFRWTVLGSVVSRLLDLGIHISNQFQSVCSWDSAIRNWPCNPPVFLFRNLLMKIQLGH